MVIVGGMLRLLLPHCRRAWFTAPPGPRALSPAALLSQAHRLGFEDAVCEPRPERALAAARSWALTLKGTPHHGGPAGEQGAGVLVTGSVYLVGELLASAGGHALSEGSGR